MSRVTKKIHQQALTETLYWQSATPGTVAEFYRYGMYLFRLKEFVPAFSYFKRASEAGSIPGKFQVACCLHEGYGAETDKAQAAELFAYVINHDEGEANCYSLYRLGYCLMYGLGITKDEEKGLAFFRRISDSVPSAVYEKALCFRFGRGGVSADPDKACSFLREAYDRFCEEAIFKLFEMHEGPFETFSYVREIKEAYSFRLGQYIRAVELNPSRDSLERLIKMYQAGFPGDTEVQDKQFRQKADKYIKQMKIIEGNTDPVLNRF